ncbi:DUF4304 domain-containing protein [Roseimicrobium sp. ORNL1]|uniref:DUF4304 domain-containing protein n=1 Tax=Roseimicrobium sp. ORNL1 TaxID=2711231 RepID=UPI0013E1FC2D|nr:DUF4304 domain-containing protein [Roseimicrobium sp. ORNL1]QIF03779.1 DUF4304 domain-containing protein [Roseimicrobium sp. ORNL1]
MNFTELLRTAHHELEPSLIEAGFRRVSGAVWNRCKGDELSVVHLQKHSVEESFCVNLGIHYAFLPKEGSLSTFDGGQIEAPECVLHLRLTENPAAKDQWWPIADSSLHQIIDLVGTRGLPIFDMYRLDGPIGKIDGKSIENGDFGPLAPMTRIRACFLLARIHERMGNRDKCVEIAAIGLKHAGMAVGPQKALKDILKRLGKNF